MLRRTGEFTRLVVVCAMLVALSGDFTHRQWRSRHAPRCLVNAIGGERRTPCSGMKIYASRGNLGPVRAC